MGFVLQHNIQYLYYIFCPIKSLFIHGYLIDCLWGIISSNHWMINKKRKLLVKVKLMTNHDNFSNPYFLSSWDPLLGSPARYKSSWPPFTRGSRGYAAAQPMFWHNCWFTVWFIIHRLSFFMLRKLVFRKALYIQSLSTLFYHPAMR